MASNSSGVVGICVACCSALWSLKASVTPSIMACMGPARFGNTGVSADETDVDVCGVAGESKDSSCASAG